MQYFPCCKLLQKDYDYLNQQTLSHKSFIRRCFTVQILISYAVSAIKLKVYVYEKKGKKKRRHIKLKQHLYKLRYK